MRDYDYSKDDRRDAIKRRRDLVNRMNSDKKRVARKKAEEEENKKNAIQPKLEIGASDDAYEQHADAVAKKVINNEDASHLVQNQPTVNATPQTKEEEDGILGGTEKLQTTLDSSKGSGQALDDKTKSEMGDKMGADLSDVKIHTDSKAHEMSDNINAKAFTHGQDIYFKQGNFDTNSIEGKELLAHELAHTQQQKGAVNRKIQKRDGDDDFGGEALDVGKFKEVRIIEGVTFGEDPKAVITAYCDYVGGIYIYDENNHIVKTNITDPTHADLRDLKAGIYFITIHTEGPDRWFTTKVIKEVDAKLAKDRPQSLRSPLFANVPELELAYKHKENSIGKGAAGDFVKRLQFALVKLNYYVGETNDGIFGNLTKSAVMKFQEQYYIGKKPDGIVGPDTLWELDRLMFNVALPKDLPNAAGKGIFVIGNVTVGVDKQGRLKYKDSSGKQIGTSPDIAKVSVFDILGNDITAATVVSNYLIDLSKNPEGMYFIQILKGKETEPVTTRVVREGPADVGPTRLETDLMGLAGRKDIDPINEMGRIGAHGDYELISATGLNIYSNPEQNALVKDTTRVKPKYNTEVHVVGRYKFSNDAEGNGWLMINTDNSGFVWVRERYVYYPSPDTGTKLHYVKSGEMLSVIARNFYGTSYRPDDIQVLVAAIVLSNKPNPANKNEEPITYDTKDGLSLNYEGIKEYAFAALDPKNVSEKIDWKQVRVKSDYNLWLPSSKVVDNMIATKQIRVSSKATRLWDMTVNLVSFIAGVVVGVFIGIWDAIVGIFEGIAGLFEFIGTLAQKIWNGEFTDYISGLWEKLKTFFNNIPDMLDKAFTDFGNMSAWEQGKSIGRLIGMIFFDVIITIITVGVLTAIKWAGRVTEGMIEIFDKLKLTEGGIFKSAAEELPKTELKQGEEIVEDMRKSGDLPPEKPVNPDKDIPVKDDPNVPKTISSKITAKTEKHIFEGEVINGKAGGVHHIDAITSGKAQIISGSKIEGVNGVYKAKVEVMDATGNWVAKMTNGGYSSFFPDIWNKQKVLEEITHAYNNKVFVNGNTWIGTSSDGLVKINMYLDNSGNIISAFPKF